MRPLSPSSVLRIQRRVRRARCFRLSAAALVLAGALDAQVGTVLEQHKIGNSDGLTGLLRARDNFGISVAPLGDLDGDGIRDVAVSAGGDDSAGRDSGAIWILFLAPDGTVRAHQRILATGPHHSHSLANLGDLDGDGVDELAYSRYRAASTAAVDIVFLGRDGTIRRSHRIDHADPVFVPAIVDAERFALFGYGLAGLGDVDGDGIGDLAIGAPGDDDGPGRENGAIWIVYLERDGRPKSAHKIGERSGGGAGRLDATFLGFSLASLGDLDGDGNVDLLANDFSGLHSSFLVLFLDAREELRDLRRNEQEELGLDPAAGYPGYDFGFGWSFAPLADLDRDGTFEFAVSAPAWTPDLDSRPELTPRPGAILVGSLRRDGAVVRSVLISRGRGGFGADLAPSTEFGYSIAALGDLRGDGGAGLLVGAYQDGAFQTGALWILELDTSAVRNGSGVNPLILWQAAQPSIGHSWKLTLDCSGRSPGSAAIAGFAAPHGGLPTPFGELLVDVFSGAPLFRLMAHHSGTATPILVAIPREVSLIGRALFVQGLCTGAPRPRLSNALDVIIGR